MATWESDQMRLASPVLRVPKFRRVRRGFDPDEVMRYLGAVEARVEQLESDSHKDAQGVRPDVADLVRTFDHVERLRREASEQMVAEAEAEAERIRVDTQFETEKARAEAERIRVDTQFETEKARADARRTLRDAQIEADGLLSELEFRREAVLSDLRAIRADMLDAASDLEATIEWGVNRSEAGTGEEGRSDQAPAPGS